MYTKYLAFKKTNDPQNIKKNGKENG